MKFKGTFATSQSGSMAGVTASHNRGGQYFRNRAIPVNPNTERQQEVRSIMATLSSYWAASLTAAERDAWDQYAFSTPLPDALGDPRNVGGKGMFIRGNSPRLLAGLSIIEAGPTTDGLPVLSPLAIASVVPGTGLSTTFTNTDSWAGNAAGRLYAFLGRGVGPQINFYKGPFRFWGALAGAATPPTSPWALAAASPYTLTVGKVYFVRYVATDSQGRMSAEQILRVTATTE